MKFSKISLLMVLPFFVFADNPIVPADRDSSQNASSKSQAQVETRSVEVTGYDTSSSYSSDEEGVEEVIVRGIRRSLLLISNEIMWELLMQLLQRTLVNFQTGI